MFVRQRFLRVVILTFFIFATANGFYFCYGTAEIVLKRGYMTENLKELSQWFQNVRDLTYSSRDKGFPLSRMFLAPQLRGRLSVEIKSGVGNVCASAFFHVVILTF